MSVRLSRVLHRAAWYATDRTGGREGHATRNVHNGFNSFIGSELSIAKRRRLVAEVLYVVQIQNRHARKRMMRGGGALKRKSKCGSYKR